MPIQKRFLPLLAAPALLAVSGCGSTSSDLTSLGLTALTVESVRFVRDAVCGSPARRSPALAVGTRQIPLNQLNHLEFVWIDGKLWQVEKR